MSDTLIGREELLTWLRAVDRSDSSVEAMREWMRAIFIGETVDLSEQDADLVMSVVYPLDSTGSDTDFLAVARTALAVLRDVEPYSQAKALLLLAWESDRLIDVLDKQLMGVISQADFEAFLRKRRWPTEIIQKIRALDVEGRSRLLNALRAQDYFAVGFIFSGVRNPFDAVAGVSEEVETRKLVDRQEVERILDAVASGDMSPDALLAWAETVIVGEKLYVGETDENDLIWDVVYGLDEYTVLGRGEVVTAAGRYCKALRATRDPGSAEMLLCLAGDHQGVLNQLRPYLTGQMTRRDYASAIQARAPRWSSQLIQSVLGLSDEELGSLAYVLQHDNYVEVLRILQL